ncbi:hypothetical protein [Mesorhizobium sp. M1027]|uniref:hypothetical protein n=1 Tax=Mesorhizobium sp. M1027 TaxID=2957050 RepID=UPI0033363AB2
MAQKITTGANDRPRNETIGQSGEGLPDDSSRPLEVDEGWVARLRNKLQGKPRQAGQTNTDEVPASTPGAGRMRRNRQGDDADRRRLSNSRKSVKRFSVRYLRQTIR